MAKTKVLVICAHAMDFIWRCGGTIAQYAKNGATVKVIALTYGSRGEADQHWKANPGITEDLVSAIRKEEAREAAKILGTEIEFYEWEDHYLHIDKHQIMQITAAIKDFGPDILLTHTADPMNPDHTSAHDAVMAAYRSAIVYGVFPEKPVITSTQVYFFEPDQPEFCGFNPAFYIDITDSMDIKKAAMDTVKSQAYLAANYTNRAEYRSHLARRLALNPGIQYAEAFMRFAPGVGKEFC